MLLKQGLGLDEILKQLKKLQRYFSKSEISRIISSSTRLLEAYQGKDRKVQAFLGYTSVNMNSESLDFV